MSGAGDAPGRAVRWMVAVAALAGAVCLGCGVKSPPVPPDLPLLPGIGGMDYRLVDGAVVLDWGLDGPLTGRQAREAVFGIYRSRSPLTDPDCPNCPLIFDRVATLPYADTPGQRFSTRLPVDKGYRYAYKVRLESGKRVGKSATPVTFDLPAKVQKP